MTTKYFIIPGLGNSGEDHWQTHFEKTGSNFIRIEQDDWDTPNCDNWIETIEKKLSGYDLDTVILIGHSLGCSTIAHWAKKYNKKIKGALLVAPSDVEALQYNFPVVGFSPMPKEKINFKTIVVASTDDQWVTIENAKQYASYWGSTFISIKNAGHLNTASGHGEWKEGLEILKNLN